MTWIILIVLVLFVLLWVITYNSLIKLRNWVEESGSQIDVQLIKRCDLVPNLIETVKGYMNHERETLEAVISARNRIVNSGSREEQLAENETLSQTLKSIFALSESYPELKANENFLMLQEELSGIENKIAYARQLYNSTVAKYNIKIESIPSNLVASTHGFKKIQQIKATDAERQNIKVKF